MTDDNDWDWIEKCGDALALFFIVWFAAKVLLMVGALAALFVLAWGVL